MHGHHHHPEHDHGGHDGHDHHGHDHTGHGHTHLPRNERKLAMAAVLTGGFMVAETVGGVISGSLALLADAGHMLTDFAALLLALLAIRIGRRPADWKRTYGFDRFSVLAAFVNGLSLFAIAIWITVEAVMRLREPTEVMGGLMLWIALAGLAVNTFSFLILTGGGEGNLNVRAAALHVMGDLLGSVAALAASLVIILTGWMPIDPILSVLVALIILRSGWAIVSESGHILLEGAPPGFDRRDVAARLMELDGVASVAHVHAWLVTQERPMVTLEMAAEPGSDIWQTKQAARSLLAEVYGISHVTIEMIDAPGQGIHCDS